MGNRKRGQRIGESSAAFNRRMGTVCGDGVVTERGLSDNMATKENWVKPFFVVLAIAGLAIAGAWAYAIAYPPQSEEDIAAVYQYRDWISALGRGDFAEADRIQPNR